MRESPFRRARRLRRRFGPRRARLIYDVSSWVFVVLVILLLAVATLGSVFTVLDLAVQYQRFIDALKEIATREGA